MKTSPKNRRPKKMRPLHYFRFARVMSPESYQTDLGRRDGKKPDALIAPLLQLFTQSTNNFSRSTPVLVAFQYRKLMTASSLGRMARFHSDHCDCAHSECLNKQSHKMTCFFVYGVAIHKEKLAFRIRRHLLQHLLQAGRGPTRTIPSESQIPALGSRIGSCWDRDTPARFAYCVCLQAEEEGKTKNTAAVLSLSLCLSLCTQVAFAPRPLDFGTHITQQRQIGARHCSQPPSAALQDSTCNACSTTPLYELSEALRQQDGLRDQIRSVISAIIHQKDKQSLVCCIGSSDSH